MKEFALAQANKIKAEIKTVRFWLDSLGNEKDDPHVFKAIRNINPESTRTIQKCKNDLIDELAERIADLQKQFDEL